MLSKKALREIENARKSKDFDFFIDEQGVYDDPMCCYLRIKIESGIYEGQIHVLQIKFVYGKGEYNYPVDPPNILFMTPIWHTNIEPGGGSICLDVIKSDAWSPMYGLDAIITSIIILLNEPNTDSPYNTDASQEYSVIVRKSKNIPKYREICQTFYTKKLTDNIKAQRLLNASDFEPC